MYSIAVMEINVSRIDKAPMGNSIDWQSSLNLKIVV